MTPEPTDKFLKQTLRSVRSFACVGISGNPIRPSYFVGRFLWRRGFDVIPVNPAYAGQQLFGSDVFAGLEQIPADRHVDVVDVFRRPEAALPIVAQAIELFPSLRVIWMQIGVVNEDAARLARNSDIDVVQNRCPKLEHQRLFGELRRAGINTGIISSRLD